MNAAALRQAVVDELRESRLRRRHLALWEQAETFEDLCRLTARFVRGELAATPNYHARRDEETVEIAEVLAHVNQRGLLTFASQPGGEGLGCCDGSVWSQRAAVQGFASGATLDRLGLLVEGTTLELHHRRADLRFLAREVDHSTAWVVSLVDDRPACSIGSTLNRRAVEFEWLALAGHLVETLVRMHQVTIIDPVYGPHTLLWERLEAL